MYAQLCIYTKNHWIAHFKWVNFMVYKLYINKAVKKKDDGDSFLLKQERLRCLWICYSHLYLCNAFQIHLILSIHYES